MKNELTARNCTSEEEAGLGMGVSQGKNIEGGGSFEGLRWLRTSFLLVPHRYTCSERRCLDQQSYHSLSAVPTILRKYNRGLYVVMSLWILGFLISLILSLLYPEDSRINAENWIGG
jgi:hypothetical protein